MHRVPDSRRGTAKTHSFVGRTVLLALVLLLSAALTPMGSANAQERSPASRGLSLPLLPSYFQSYTVDDPDAFVYAVRLGEYWILIARKFGVTYDELRAANPELWALRGELIRPGDEMAIPGLTAEDQRAPETYVVQPGDSWYKIADTVGVSYWDLRLDNLGLWRLRGVVIQPGDEMQIIHPPGPAPEAEAKSAPEATPAPISAEAAQPTPTPAPSQAESPAAAPGTLPPVTSASPPYRVTNPPTDAVIYIVRPGDSWFSIANRYGMTFEKLRSANQELWSLRGQNIRPADEMVIPAHGSPPPPLEIKTSPDKETPETDDGSYIVQEGDTWESVAEATDLTVEALKEANVDVSARDLIPGDVLRMP